MFLLISISVSGRTIKSSSPPIRKHKSLSLSKKKGRYYSPFKDLIYFGDIDVHMIKTQLLL
jgi:hypothetical protein